MALEALLRTSTGSITSTFSPHMEMSVSSSESSTAPHSQFRPRSTGSVESGSLRPSSALARPSSANNYLMSPSDIVGPSPVTSVGTEITEIDDEASDEVRSQPTAANPNQQPELLMLRTDIPDQVRQITNEETISVIHAPESFRSWKATNNSPKYSESTERTSSRSPISPETEDSTALSTSRQAPKSKIPGLPTPPPLSTNVKPVRYSIDSATPRAQDLQEIMSESSRIRSSSASSLELIPEYREPETDAEPDQESYDDEYTTPVRVQDGEDVEIKSLETALQECWTLCNTLASLSTHHRERVFSTSGTPDGHERAWKCCWKLCQRLYNNHRDEADESFNVRRNLDLCRDFCQALFDIRQRKDEVSDSVLRVSFELNNHLYSAQDNRALPEAFRERTLDFYITLCHRLMKQRGELGEETDSLLSACWSLAEMLFSLRQNKRDKRAPDGELLGSAVQACWELCDIFREGWTQIRPDRGTPRPSQANFFSYNREREIAELTDGRESRTSSRSKTGSLKNHTSQGGKVMRKPPPVPETPVTEFEDTPVSPDTESPQVPNILVLGTESNRGGRWSSSASNFSSYSQSSQRTSSTATTATTNEDPNITRIKVLILKAALNVGFSRESSGPDGHHHNSAASLQAFVKSLPNGSFGSLPSHAALLQSYKNLVVGDSPFRQATALPSRGKRVSAVDVAKSVDWMTHRSSSYGFLRDLFKLVFGFQVEEAEGRRTVNITV
ncbi:uncharacterized protein F4812DRAFT_461802 [Daldinia caldariorum]|uniref:uncharacterized protein n=1 Tax=Daldinia caldariorum TaxID=326644 RepID=UPI002007ECDE|nr:uncharacterized protein F4812DRAFT_461802 [Daldinia caldariorum]KAI1465489.1 hypothetical protein F4812DRAFT_461802 [Daldinia caldariorum]